MSVTSMHFHFLDECVNPELILHTSSVKAAIFIILQLRSQYDHGARLPCLISPKRALHPSLITHHHHVHATIVLSQVK